jgi:hypothetical protein
VNKTRMPFNYKMKIFGLWVLPGSDMGPLDDQGKRHMKEAIELFRSGAKIGAKT